MKENNLHYTNPFMRQLNQKPQTCFGTVVKTENYTRGIGEGLDFGSEDLTYQLGAYIDKRDWYMFGGKLGLERAVKHTDPRLGFLLENFDDPETKERLRTYLGLEAQVVRPSDIRDDETKQYIKKLRSDGKRLHDLSVDEIAEICKKDETVVKDFLIDNIDGGNHVLVNFRYEPFSGREDGHYVFVAALEESKPTQLYVADPSPFNPDYWKEDLTKFLYSMMPLWKGGKRERGFVVFSGRNRRRKDNPERIKEFLNSVPKYHPSITRLRRMRPHPETHLSIREKQKVA